MAWLFAQVWLWSIAAFAVGALVTWLLFVRPLRGQVHELNSRLDEWEAAAFEAAPAPEWQAPGSYAAHEPANAAPRARPYAAHSDAEVGVDSGGAEESRERTVTFDSWPSRDPRGSGDNSTRAPESAEPEAEPSWWMTEATTGEPATDETALPGVNLPPFPRPGDPGAVSEARWTEDSRREVSWFDEDLEDEQQYRYASGMSGELNQYGRAETSRGHAEPSAADGAAAHSTSQEANDPDTSWISGQLRSLFNDTGSRAFDGPADNGVEPEPLPRRTPGAAPGPSRTSGQDGTASSGEDDENEDRDGR